MHWCMTQGERSGGRRQNIASESDQGEEGCYFEGF